MRLLKTAIHPEVSRDSDKILHRRACRAIILEGENILLLHTRRYDDYTLPGGGVDAGESLEQGLIRELQEETGARNIQNIQPFGHYAEFRPWYRDDCDVMHMDSYCFRCEIDAELGPNQLEPHELQNGMTPLWINIHKALAHNEHTYANSAKKGLSLEREIYLLKRIRDELLTSQSATPDG